MKRIAVVGCPGSGKTTFAVNLAKKIGLPVIHLDFYYHQTEHDYYHNKEAWITKVDKLIQQDTWIMDGNYSSSFAQRFKRADTIIFFDFPRRKSMWGVLKRRVQYRNKRRSDMPDNWKEKANAEFLRYVWNFPGESRTKLLYALKQNKHKRIITFTNRKQAQQFIKGQQNNKIDNKAQV